LCRPQVACTALLLLCPHPAASMYFPVTFVARGDLTVLFSWLHAPYLNLTWSPAVAEALRADDTVEAYMTYWDDEHQRNYYVHKVTGKAMWTLPTTPVVLPPPAPDRRFDHLRPVDVPRHLRQNPYVLSETVTSAKVIAQVRRWCKALSGLQHRCYNTLFETCRFNFNVSPLA
jgi:hypothetical protein